MLVNITFVIITIIIVAVTICSYKNIFMILPPPELVPRNICNLSLKIRGGLAIKWGGGV